jgi:hypothetical protein
MEKQLKAYLRFLEEDLPNAAPDELPVLWQQHIIKMKAFQHERHMHLLVTLFFGTLVFLCFVLLFLVLSGTIVSKCSFYGIDSNTGVGVIPLFALSFGLLILEIFYIRHYYILENGIQKIYIYDHCFFSSGTGVKE